MSHSVLVQTSSDYSLQTQNHRHIQSYEHPSGPILILIMQRTQNCIGNSKFKVFKKKQIWVSSKTLLPGARIDVIYVNVRETQIRIFTSLIDDVERAVDDVVELEGIIGVSETLYVERVVLLPSKIFTQTKSVSVFFSSFVQFNVLLE